MSQEHEDGLRRALDAFNRRDKDRFLALCHPDIENVPPRDWPEFISTRGHEAVWEFFVANRDPWDASPLEYVEFIEAGNDRIAALVEGEVRGRASGAGVRWRFWQLSTFREGKVLRVEWFGDRAEVLEAAGI